MRKRYLISGRVQGVGFRYFVRRAAGRLGVTGWVRNLASGEVEAEGQGAEEVLEMFEVELRRGPPGSLVTEFSVTGVSDEVRGATGFSIG